MIVREVETIESVEYYKVTSGDHKSSNLIMVLNGKNAYSLQYNKEWTLIKGLYDYLFYNDDSLDRKIELLDLQEAIKEAINKHAEIITRVEYYKVSNKEGLNENFIMVLNEHYAYRLQNNGKWVFRTGLYDYLFNNDDSLDRNIEILPLNEAMKEEILREKNIYKKI